MDIVEFSQKPGRLAIFAGRDSAEAVLNSYMSLAVNSSKQYSVYLAKDTRKSVRLARRSGADLIFYIGGYLDPGTLEELIQATQTGAAVAIAVPGSFSDAQQYVSEHQLAPFIEVFDGSLL